MEALGTLAGGIAQDFNNILSSMIGFAELAKLGLEEDHERTDYLDHVLSAGVRARNLVKHILTFSRRADATKDIIPVLPLLKECLKFLKASVSPNIEIHHHFTEEKISVLSDPTQLHQIFMNLLTNAAYAMKENGGRLEVTLDSVDILQDDIHQFKELSSGNYAQIIISDTGCGISKHLIGKIFEPFFTTKPRG
jgi:signal transduction histidine kinase